MRFEQRLRESIHDGSITVTFRRWKRHQVVPGGRYRTGTGLVEVDTVDVIDPARISRADARRAGYESVAALVKDLRGDPAEQVFRIALHPLDTPDPRSVLALTDQALGLTLSQPVGYRLSPRGHAYRAASRPAP
jgi:hypothetical protein